MGRSLEGKTKLEKRNSKFGKKEAGDGREVFEAVSESRFLASLGMTGLFRREGLTMKL
jgi:hypothetical protein